MSSAFSLGQFQLNNLVELKIPFIISHPNLDFSKFFTGEFLQHIQKYSEPFVGPDQILQIMKSKGYPMHWPVVWICENGIQSKIFADSGESFGLINCNYLESGINGFAR